MYRILIGIIIAGIGFGYWDANAEKKVSVDLSARVATLWGLYYDSMEYYGQLENGQLFVQLNWSQPSDKKRVSSIRIKGNIQDGNQPITSFDEPCQRGGSSWLGDAKWSYNGNVSTDLVCFVMIDKVLKPTTPGGLVTMDEAKARIANMRVTYSAEIWAVNIPMRYITWVNEQASRLSELVSTPFKRQ
ncbi:hypothetical protein [Ensifer canadensis]